MLPYSVLIKGRALRAIGDASGAIVQELRGGVWTWQASCHNFNAARRMVVDLQALNLQNIKAVS